MKPLHHIKSIAYLYDPCDIGAYKKETLVFSNGITFVYFDYCFN